ncbi:MAG: response regulator [Chloroflexi bacterium]|nr:MAG: response regulator [Chloroflexota bacterium]
MTETSGGKLILIVEDNEKNLKLARDVLQFSGFQTLEAGTGEAAVDLARQRRPDLILMDIELPGIDGITALQQLRADAQTAQIPIVALTASAMSADRDRFFSAGFDGYISKPINIKEFPNQVLAHCERVGRGRP